MFFPTRIGLLGASCLNVAGHGGGVEWVPKMGFNEKRAETEEQGLIRKKERERSEVTLPKHIVRMLGLRFMYNIYLLFQ